MIKRDGYKFFLLAVHTSTQAKITQGTKFSLGLRLLKGLELGPVPELELLPQKKVSSKLLII